MRISAFINNCALSRDWLITKGIIKLRVRKNHIEIIAREFESGITLKPNEEFVIVIKEGSEMIWQE